MLGNFCSLRSLSAIQVRHLIRDGRYQMHTAGLAQGKLQTNLVIMPQNFALDFMRYCQRNVKPCPLVGVSDTGVPHIATLGSEINLLTDVPAYNIYINGKFSKEVSDITSFWRDDFVAFAIGCSFTFEQALQNANIPLWHIENNKTIPMFRTNIETIPAGPFEGNMVVSMRAIEESRLEEVIEISKEFPYAHGRPVFWGDPARINIQDISRPDWGDASPLEKGQIPVFWACGVTPQAAVDRANLPICITHKPGHMLVTDVDDDAEIPTVF